MQDRLRKPKRPRDSNQLAYEIVKEATEGPPEPEPDTRNQAAVELGKLGGAKGGRARAARMTPEERSEAARKAAAARWAKTDASGN